MRRLVREVVRRLVKVDKPDWPGAVTMVTSPSTVPKRPVCCKARSRIAVSVRMISLSPKLTLPQPR